MTRGAHLSELRAAVREVAHAVVADALAACTQARGGIRAKARAGPLPPSDSLTAQVEPPQPCAATASREEAAQPVVRHAHAADQGHAREGGAVAAERGQ